ncbi:hypothetical protein DFH09DRAFT_1112999 [Mycena vulgaris]|nr:hypothetical protein DFH09DRAFT_1112999 [Mycena vulgaris]
MNQIAAGKAPTATESLVLSDPSVPKIKQDFNDKLESFANDIAQMKDREVLREKCLLETLASLKASFTQGTRDPPPHQEQFRNKDSYNQGGGGNQSRNNEECRNNDERPRNEERDCPEKQEHINNGRIIMEKKIIKLSNGQQIPSFPPYKSRKERVDDYYANKGIPKLIEPAMWQSYNPSSYYLHHHSYESGVDSVRDVYDSRDDELKSMRIQRALQQQQQQFAHQQQPQQQDKRLAQT